MDDAPVIASDDAGPIPWTKANAAIEFSKRTTALFEFSHEIENALAEDYFHNPSSTPIRC